MTLALEGFEFRDGQALRFSPGQPFLLRGVLFWQGTGVLSSLRIAGEEQIVMSLTPTVMVMVLGRSFVQTCEPGAATCQS